MLPSNVDDPLQPIVYEALSQSQATAECQQTLIRPQRTQRSSVAVATPGCCR
ncbi:MAG: hypothetical protein JWN03_8478 [Nocardia sp.]|nr:hypothetical protein [Nocardia sp.]